MTVSLSAHFDGKTIVLDEYYALLPQAKLLGRSAVMSG